MREAELKKGKSPKDRTQRAQMVKAKKFGIGLPVENNLQHDITTWNLQEEKGTINNFW